MCGILGMIGNVPHHLQLEAYSLLRNLFMVSTSRGKDASGYAAIHGDEAASLVLEKRPIPATKLVKKDIKFKTLRKSMPSVFIGHTRLATSGKPNRGRNNHPFSNDTYCMVHNGKIKDWKKVVESQGITMRSETDSEILLRLIERYENPKDGVQAIIDSVHKDSDMAVALMRHDPNNPGLILFRNAGRPMSIITIDNFRAVFFASTKSIVETAFKMLYKNEVTARMKELGVGIADVPTFRMLEFEFNNQGNIFAHPPVEITKPVVAYLPINKTPHVAAQSRAVPNKFSVEDATNDTKTEKLIKNAPGPTREKVTTLARAADESTKIVKLIRQQPFMTQVEINHWKKYRFKV